MACSSCGAARGHLIDCPIGGFSQVVSSAPTSAARPAADDEATRARHLRIALPVVLAAMLLLAHTGPGRALTGILFAMWLHEFGHASAAWLCGAPALPLPWVTLGGEATAPSFVVLELLLLGLWLWRSRVRAPPLLVLGLLVIGVLLPAHTQSVLLVFGGDAGALIFGALLMAAVHLPDESRLSRGGLRWGYLVIGAGAFANVTAQWLAAWRDPAELPFGTIEGVGLSDASKLVDVFHWSESRLVHSYLGLAAVCVLALAALNTWSWLRARERQRSGL